MNIELTAQEVADIKALGNLLFPESPQGFVTAKMEDALLIKQLKAEVDELKEFIKTNLQ